MFLSERTLDRFVDQFDFNLDVKYILPDDEYYILDDEGLLDETRDHIYVPNGLVDKPSVYKVTKLITESFDIMRFMDQIIETVSFPFEVSVNVGFFVANIHCPEMKEYIKPASTSSVVTASLTNLENYWRFRREMLKLSSGIACKSWENACDRRQINRDTFPTTAIMICVYIQKL